MNSKKLKLIVGVLAVLLIFVIATFSKNWGTASSVAKIEQITPIVKALKSDPIKARQKCPSIIRKLNKGLPELQRSGAKDKELISYKLIADCSFAGHDFNSAADAYKKLAFAEPQVAKWHGLVAESLYQAGKYGEALPISTLATQLSPTDFNLKRLNARLLAKLGLVNRATNAYREVIKIAPYEFLEQTQDELNQLLILHTPIQTFD